MKKLFALLLILSLGVIVGCSSTPDIEESIGLVLPTANYAIYNANEFSIQYPVNWSVLSSNEISSRYRESLEVAFISNFKDLFFTPVITIEKVEVDSDLNSMEFADSIILSNSNRLIEYVLVDRQGVTLERNEAPVLTEIVKFRGKERLQDDALEYIQIYIKSDSTGYIVTGAYDPTNNNSEVDKIVASLKTLKLK